MNTTLTMSFEELQTVLIALNVEQAREMKKGTPNGRKCVTELRDRVAEQVKTIFEGRRSADRGRAFGPGMTPHADDCECYVCSQAHATNSIVG